MAFDEVSFDEVAFDDLKINRLSGIRLSVRPPEIRNATHSFRSEKKNFLMIIIFLFFW
jgi:hypothetical protein